VLAQYMLLSSVCHSVANHCCTKMAKRSFMQTMPHDSPGTSLVMSDICKLLPTTGWRGGATGRALDL